MTTTRFWVAIPGERETVEMTAQELAERLHQQKFLAGTKVMRFDELEWRDPEAVPEVQSAIEAITSRSNAENAPPLSSSAAGAEILESQPHIARSITDEAFIEKSAPPVPIEESPLQSEVANAEAPNSRRTAIVAVALAGVLLSVGSVAVFAWVRFGYSHGQVLEHIPPDCARLTYVDFAAIDQSLAARAIAKKRERTLIDWAEDLDDAEGIKRSTDDDARGRAATLATLDKLGVRPYHTVAELAHCTIHDDESVDDLWVIGGTFRGKNLLAAIREALVHRRHRSKSAKDDDLVLEESGGRTFLHLERDRYLTMATPQVALIGLKKTILRFTSSRPTSHNYGLREADAIVELWEPTDKKGAIEERYTVFADRVVVTRTWANGDGSDEINVAQQRFKSSAERLRRNRGLDALADAYDTASVKLEGAELKSDITFRMNDLSSVAKVIVDADRREMKDIVDALHAAPGTDYLQYAVIPSIDYFGLRLTPWTP
ncbi:MAG: hypothetical protein NVS3B20_18100 [Polyangiales bacterium]